MPSISPTPSATGKPAGVSDPPSGVPSSLEGPEPPPPPRAFSSCWGLQPKRLPPPLGPFLAFSAVVVLFHFVVVLFSFLLKYQIFF